MNSTTSKGKFTKSKVLFKEEFENLEHTLIKISEEKLRLELNDYEKSVREKYSWLAPFGVFLTLVTAIITTDFKDAISLSKHTWEAIYYLGAFSCFAYSLVSLLKSNKKDITIEALINRIKNKT